MSDHRKISFNIHAATAIKTVTRRGHKKVDWREFTKCLDLDDLAVTVNNDIDLLSEQLEAHLGRALDAVAPLKGFKVKATGSLWSNSLNLKRRILKNLYRKRSLHKRILEKYKELKKDYSNEIQKAKRGAWRDFCSKAESASDISKLVQILENPPSRTMSLLNNGRILTPDMSVELLLKTHFPEGRLEDGDAILDYDLVELTGMEKTGVHQYITTQKIEAVFASFGDYKSPGPDELPPIAMKNLNTRGRELVCRLYKLSICTGHVPRLWRVMKVVFLPKAGKADYAVAKAYRPITLSNFILKGLERIIHWYILENIITRPLARQHAYTKGRSCDTALSCFVDEIERTIYNGQFLLAVSLDCSGASNLRLQPRVCKQRISRWILYDGTIISSGGG